MRVLLALSLVVVLTLVAVWDVYCAATGRQNDTVSATMQEWSQNHPMLAVTVGVILGHIFWPTRPRP